jgi:hypothetical protein
MADDQPNHKAVAQFGIDESVTVPAEILRRHVTKGKGGMRRRHCVSHTYNDMKKTFLNNNPFR